MCTHTIHLPNKAVYYSRFHSDIANEVPCGKCEECRQSRRNEWCTRLSFELDNCYKRGGRAVFLTFTYDNENLPVYEDVERNFKVCCFNHIHVKMFLNRLKVWCYKRYGANSYKYYWCSEFGKYTKRPHYHALFFLSSTIAPTDDAIIPFVEACREKWPFGFMFPKFDKKIKQYVDDKGLLNWPLIREQVAGAKYISKYITKDMFYFGMSKVAWYLDDASCKEKMKEYLPKSFVSKGLGYSIIDSLDLSSDSKIKDVLSSGVLNPLTKKMIPLPRYVIDKLMYRNVSTKDTRFERYSELSGRYLYDRILTPFGKKYLKYAFKEKVTRTSQRIQKLFVSVIDADVYHVCMDLCKSLHIDINNVRSFDDFSLFHCFWSRKSDELFSQYLLEHGGDESSLFDIEDISEEYVRGKDNNFLRWCASTTKQGTNSFLLCFFPTYTALDGLLNRISDEVYVNRAEQVKRHYDTVDRMKYQNMYRFDKTLC